MGTTMRMGPGYFPTVLGWLLALIGLALVVRISVSTWDVRGTLGLRQGRSGNGRQRTLCPASAPTGARPCPRSACDAERVREQTVPMAHRRDSRHRAGRRLFDHLRVAAETTDPDARDLARGLGHGNIFRPGHWLSCCIHALQPALLPHRRFCRHTDRRPARPRACSDSGHAHAGIIPPSARLIAHHAGRDLLRGAVRRINHFNPGKPARRGFLHRYNP